MDCTAANAQFIYALGIAIFLIIMMILYDVIFNKDETENPSMRTDKLNYQGFVQYVNLMRQEGIPISEMIEKKIEDNRHLG